MAADVVVRIAIVQAILISYAESLVGCAIQLSYLPAMSCISRDAETLARRRCADELWYVERGCEA